MEHPIPANVTSFQFHLVGDMTLKQFAYLGTGMGVAYLTFVVLFPISPYLALPIIILSVIFGAAFAFVPILDRPLDHWVLAFFKAVYSPTKGKWKSPFGKSLPQDPVYINRLQLYLSPNQPRLSRIIPTNGKLDSRNLTLANNQTPNFQHLNPASNIQHPTSNPQPLPPPPPIQPLPPSQPQLNQVQPANIPSPEELSSLVNMAKEVQIMQAKTAHTEKQKVVVVEAAKPQRTQLLLTSFPNIINGIITDSSGNYLDGVIVIIHDKDGIPVRALKTNKIGQFTGATPLPPGTYNITLEKDGFEFDALQVTLNDEVLAPLQIQPRKGEI